MHPHWQAFLSEVAEHAAAIGREPRVEPFRTLCAYLDEVGPVGVPLLVACLGEPAELLQLHAIWGLERLGEAAGPAAAHALEAYFDGPSVVFYEQAIAALEAIDPARVHARGLHRRGFPVSRLRHVPPRRHSAVDRRLRLARRG